MERFQQALLFAARVHQGQQRKGTTVPYIAHLLGVTALAMEHGATEDEAIGALLHDAAEDRGGEAMLAEIRAQFGDAVGDIVLGCSDSLVENPADKRPWLDRKHDYVAHVAEATASECLVSAADKLHNVRAVIRDYRAMGDAVWDRFTGGRDGTLWYYEAVSLALWRRWPSTLSDELRRDVEQLLTLARHGHDD
jgi:(p)ppGpp synthase/HD superfamily hydrolase